MANKFKAITSKPNKNNPYIYLYNNRNNGGKSLCINGKPTDRTCNVLCNCVGWACARFNHIYNEITGYNGIKFPRFCCNAENFIEVAKNYKLAIGQVPQPGAIMVWQKGKSLFSKDGAGHVAIVETVIDKNKIITSESGYNSFVFANRTRTNNGNWGAGSKYKFRGFIYNPAVNKHTIVVSDETNIPIPINRNNSIDQIEIKINNLNVRTRYGLSSASKGFAKQGFYNFTDKSIKDGYTWYKIGENAWVAYKPEWCTIYPKENIIQIQNNIKLGNIAKIKYGAPIYGTNSRFASWVYNSPVYIRNINGNKITISIYRKGPITGSVDKKYLLIK